MTSLNNIVMKELLLQVELLKNEIKELKQNAFIKKPLI